MRYLSTFGALLASALLGACNPTLNWRDVRTQDATLLALFPCKPETAERKVPLGEAVVTMKMLGCEAAGATFALAYADLKDASHAGPALEQLKTVTLGKLRAKISHNAPFVLKGAPTLPQSLQVDAVGTLQDGTTPVRAQLAWFTAGNQVFQAAVYTPVNAESAQPGEFEAFFSGFRLP